MMPAFTVQSPRNARRASAIADELLKKNLNILCFEKVFDSKAHKVLADKLAGRYPFQYGPVNDWCSLKVNGGVWVISNIPLQPVAEIEFRDCAGVECLSRKGAILLVGEFQGHVFRLIATHLQGEEGAMPTPEHESIRAKQMRQIKEELINPYRQANVPLFICGDFCTPRRDLEHPLQNTRAYDDMIHLFEAENGPNDRVTLNDNRWRNDLATDDSGRNDELDYILVKKNGTALLTDWDIEVMRSKQWDGANGRHDLSYRYAVSASISFRNQGTILNDLERSEK